MALGNEVAIANDPEEVNIVVSFICFIEAIHTKLSGSNLHLLKPCK